MSSHFSPNGCHRIDSISPRAISTISPLCRYKRKIFIIIKYPRQLKTPSLTSDIFGIIEGPPLHDPLAVAAVLAGTPWEIRLDDRRPDAYDDAKPPSERTPHPEPERFGVRVVLEGTHDDALHRGARLGQTVATLLPPGEPGVRIPRGLDIPKFWRVLEECVQRADDTNEALRRAAAGKA